MDPRHRIDLDTLQRFVPVISRIEYKSKCHNSYNALFRAHDMDSREHYKLRCWTGLSEPVNFKVGSRAVLRLSGKLLRRKPQ